MQPIIKNTIALLLGIVIGGFVNMGIINLSGIIIPPPRGIDLTTMEGLLEGMKLFEPKHFIMPFLAHAVGTFVGAVIVARMAAKYNKTLALAIGVFFLLGGIYMVVLLPSPLWFNILDLGIAYIPMAFFGYKLAMKQKS